MDNCEDASRSAALLTVEAFADSKAAMLQLVSTSADTRDKRDDRATGTQLSEAFSWSQRMYAIAFDLDTKLLAIHHPNGDAYGVIERVFFKYGFTRKQGSLFFGSAKDTDPVKCVLAVQELANKHPWFRIVVRDIRMLRIEDNNDLMPAVGQPALDFGPPGIMAAE